MPVELTAEERHARENAREAFSANIHHPDAVAQFPLPTPEESFHQGWDAGYDHKADSETTVRMLADALKELADWAEGLIEGEVVVGFRVDGRSVLGEARATLDALNEPVETQEKVT